MRGRSPSLRNAVHLEVDNRLFYTQDWPTKVQEAVHAMGYRLPDELVPVQIDLAFDTTQPLEDRMQDIYVQSRLTARKGDSSYRYQPKFTAFIRPEKTGGYTIGSDSAGRAVSIYNKTKECSVKPKPYISAFHQSVGLSTTPIFRCEVHMTRRYLNTKKRKHPPIQFDRLHDPKYLLSLGLRHARPWLQWSDRENIIGHDKHGNERFEEVEVLDWPSSIAPLPELQPTECVDDFKFQNAKQSFRYDLELWLRTGLVSTLHHLRSVIATQPIEAGLPQSQQWPHYQKRIRTIAERFSYLTHDQHIRARCAYAERTLDPYRGKRVKMGARKKRPRAVRRTGELLSRGTKTKEYEPGPVAHPSCIRYVRQRRAYLLTLITVPRGRPPPFVRSR